MKIIISHDVDHIDTVDHICKDFILEKMFIRSILQVVSGKISWETCLYRMTMILRGHMNRITEIMDYDRQNNIPSTFFFGMANGLGMSYSRRKAAEYIFRVIENGFDVGVHGIDYQKQERICDEHDRFREITGMKLFGIRNHYVRFNDETFIKMNNAGYLFDTTYFNKGKTELINPYKVDEMWEFPLHIMDGYVCEQGKLKEGIANTRKIIDKAEALGIRYLTILFHDHQFDDDFDPQLKEWYMSTVEYCQRKGYEFISYRDAIEELENG